MEPGSYCLNGVTNARGFMSWQVIHDGDVFRAYVEQFLAPTLRAGDRVIMHRARGSKKI